jgi:hypothetical protein
MHFAELFLLAEEKLCNEKRAKKKEERYPPLADPGPVEDFYIAKRICKVVLHTVKEKDDDKGKEAQRTQFWTVEASFGSGHEVMLPTEILQAGLHFPKCMVRRPTAREKRRVDRQICANVFGL